MDFSRQLAIVTIGNLIIIHSMVLLTLNVDGSSHVHQHVPCARALPSRARHSPSPQGVARAQLFQPAWSRRRLACDMLLRPPQINQGLLLDILAYSVPLRWASLCAGQALGDAASARGKLCQSQSTRSVQGSNQRPSGHVRARGPPLKAA